MNLWFRCPFCLSLLYCLSGALQLFSARQKTHKVQFPLIKMDDPLASFRHWIHRAAASNVSSWCWTFCQIVDRKQDHRIAVTRMINGLESVVKKYDSNVPGLYGTLLTLATLEKHKGFRKVPGLSLWQLLFHEKPEVSDKFDRQQSATIFGGLD